MSFGGLHQTLDRISHCPRQIYHQTHLLRYDKAGANSHCGRHGQRQPNVPGTERTASDDHTLRRNHTPKFLLVGHHCAVLVSSAPWRIGIASGLDSKGAPSCRMDGKAEPDGRTVNAFIRYTAQGLIQQPPQSAQSPDTAYWTRRSNERQENEAQSNQCFRAARYICAETVQWRNRRSSTARIPDVNDSKLMMMRRRDDSEYEKPEAGNGMRRRRATGWLRIRRSRRRGRRVEDKAEVSRALGASNTGGAHANKQMFPNWRLDGGWRRQREARVDVSGQALEPRQRRSLALM